MCTSGSAVFLPALTTRVSELKHNEILLLYIREIGCVRVTNQTLLVLFSKCLKPVQLLFGPDPTAPNLAQNIPFSPG